MLKQNGGEKPKQMHNPHGGKEGAVPGTGSPAVRFHGTMVHAEKRAGVTTPAKGAAGSHSHLEREHAEHSR